MLFSSCHGSIFLHRTNSEIRHHIQLIPTLHSLVIIHFVLFRIDDVFSHHSRSPSLVFLPSFLGAVTTQRAAAEAPLSVPPPATPEHPADHRPCLWRERHPEAPETFVLEKSLREMWSFGIFLMIENELMKDEM